MGLDPGIRTGCKIAVVDTTGKLLETATIYPHEPRRDWNGSLATLAPGQATQRRAVLDRQRHGQPRNRQAGAGPDEGRPS
jgi:transcriptional accessory protein Tex/SPT6